MTVEPLPPSSDRRSRFAGLTVSLVLLLALVAISSRSGFGASGGTAPNNTYISYAMSVFLIVFVLMIPVAIYSYVMRTQEIGPEGRAPKKRLWHMLALIVLFGLGVYARHWVQLHGGFFSHGGLFNHLRAPKSGDALHHGGTKPQTQPHFEYSVLWAFFALVAVLLVAWLVQRARREDEPAEDAATPQSQLAGAISDAIDDLEREPDPRRAVIAAYARMERELGRHGLPRRASETSVEYLRRALHEQTARSHSVERLTALFERAKFSHHEITPEMKQEAIDALVDIREGITA